MAQFPDQTDIQTDAFPLAQPSTRARASSRANTRKVAGISAAAMLLGGAAWAVAQKIEDRGPKSDSTTEEAISTPSPTIDLPPDIDIAGKVTDTMSFDQAFQTARREVGMGGVFGWHGHWYNTFEKEEWSSLSLEQRQEYTEMITGEKLPVKPYGKTPTTENQAVSTEIEPTIIEGHLNGQRVMGLDFDEDGIIDTLVLDGADGNTYRVVDATGNAGLDTLYQYDSLDGELTGVVRLEQPFVLTNDDFSQYLEDTMSKEVVDSILEPDATTAPVTDTSEVLVEAPEDDTSYPVDAYQPDDDTYVNNGDVRDMDE